MTFFSRNALLLSVSTCPAVPIDKTRRPTTPQQHPSSHFYFFLFFLFNFSPLFFFFLVLPLKLFQYRIHGPIHTIRQMAPCALQEARASAPGVDRNISTAAPPPSPPPPLRIIISLSPRAASASQTERRREKERRRACFATQPRWLSST